MHSAAAKKLRIKVGPDGVKVLLPEGRQVSEAEEFIAKNRAWVAEQLDRTHRMMAIRRPKEPVESCVLYRGESVRVVVVQDEHRRAPNQVLMEGDVITITAGPSSIAAASRSLENWMRKQARERIKCHVSNFKRRIKRSPNRIYVMSQRTKWGNCSSLGNLSFNWRLVMAPDNVMGYLVAHEMVHLAIPDHSQKFWLTVQSLCPNAERSRQWLVANGHQLLTAQLPVKFEGCG